MTLEKMMRTTTKLLILVAASALVAGCSNKQKAQKQSETAEVAQTKTAQPLPGPKQVEQTLDPPKRIILMIGDGMGVPAITAASYAKGAPLDMLGMPVVSMMRTHEFEYLTTDSAASATAFATGQKTHYEGLSVTPGTTPAQEEDASHHFETTVKAAQRAGWRTGLVATSRIVHATPAAFASHRQNRRSYEEIARDMLDAGPDVMLGAGTSYFTRREDGADLLGEFGARGYTVATTPDEVQAARASASKLVGLMHDEDMPPVLEDARAMSLAEMTSTAIDVLDRDNPDGFFLMVEGSQIDWSEHAMDGEGTIAETLDFDEAVRAARAYAAKREDTLVIVTADHDTGGLTVLDEPSSAPYVERLGGREEVAKMATSEVAGMEYPEPVEAHALGQGALGPTEYEGTDFHTTFGYLSVASRGMWMGRAPLIATHTATMVPLMSEGKGAEFIEGIRDNADLGRFIRAAILGTADAEMTSAEEASLTRTADTFSVERPRNVIVLVGDGMGIAPVTAAYYARGGLAMTGMPVTGLVSTHATDRVVNDSAASATALATGERTRYGAVGVVPRGDELVAAPTVLERAEAAGMRTGLVTTTTLTHATPASFYAHHPERRQEDLIAGQFVDLPERIKGSDGVDVAFGGGRVFFSKEHRAALKARGVTVLDEWSDEPAPPGEQVLRLLADRGLPSAPERMGADARGPTLKAMTASALATLSGEDEPFFLMVEGGQIDWAQHDLDTSERLIDEIKDFDDAVAQALAIAKHRGDTLVVVTADHDHTLSLLDNHYGFVNGHCGAAKRCGGPVTMQEVSVRPDQIHRGEGLDDAALQGEFAPPALILQYGWLPMAASRVKPISGPHSANFVPLFAYGPGSEALRGFHDQPEIGRYLLEWAGTSE